MSLVRLAARPMLAAPFIWTGLERLRNPCSNKIASLLLRYEKTHRDAKDENGKVTA